ncbi:GbsR/MarR family transcriptional regulator [Salinibacter ruber]|uniref:GbsR/MarR family transcriptional regulator n=1 Tax=Salinibacter ruber TaxID=146919 RepID=UPI002167E551|nr:MarR family transcriptional regulator [Salinibacter ruber]MCS3757549.1 DNA-binding transcriptional regulator GbsR (MarR family) [Salinibacter ruber]MCS3956635.1 DNA-binding transcriptional regulator GbsR (MarR family) [Salinibacter ruber]MCS4087981.1 DNA-binding transcriptional regulator GbsR (MarR family) [Salinibacter ruber]
MPSSEPSGLDPLNLDRSSQARVAVDRFVSLWGEMASTWGINRTMARIHALLYCAGRPLSTDEVMECLEVSRGNASMNLRSLVDWNLVDKTHRSGSRKDYYRAETDVWQITARIIEERQRREVHPVRSRLQECADLLVQDGASGADYPEPERALHQRLTSLIDLLKVLEGVSEALLPLVRNKDIDQIEQLLAVALRRGESESTPSSSDPS